MEPRLNEPMDSGVLYHSQGESGVTDWRSWMLSQELRSWEKSFGDYWSQMTSLMTSGQPGPRGGELPFRSGRRPLLSSVPEPAYPGMAASRGLRESDGRLAPWSLICSRGKSLHFVNGHVVMALANSRTWEAP